MLTMVYFHLHTTNNAQYSQFYLHLRKFYALAAKFPVPVGCLVLCVCSFSSCLPRYSLKANKQLYTFNRKARTSPSTVYKHILSVMIVHIITAHFTLVICLHLNRTWFVMTGRHPTVWNVHVAHPYLRISLALILINCWCKSFSG